MILACGHEGDPRSKMCRACWEGDKGQFTCPGCGAKKHRYAELCRQCRAKANTIERKCQDCGHIFPASMRLTKTMRCRPCLDTYKRNLPKPICIIDGCEKPQRKWQRCNSHAQAYYKVNRPQPVGLRASGHATVGSKPCAACSWQAGTVDVHRAIPAAGYTNGNMIPLCPNCHRLVHAGSIPLPSIRF